MKKRIVFVFLVLLIFFTSYKVYGKYVKTSDIGEIIKINKIDTVKPTINGRNTDVYDEEFKENVIVEYSDEFGIGSAKYWFNPNSKEFIR